MNIPLKMKFSTDIWHNEIIDGKEGPYYGNVLCAFVKDVEVDVFSMLPDAIGTEFTYHFNYTGNLEEDLAKLSTDTDYQKAVLAISLSANNGWGHANCSCFKPLSSYTENFLEEE